MGKTIDCKTLQGPASVLKIRNCLKREPITDLTIIVDNDPAVDDVTLYLSNQEFEICVDTIGNFTKIIGHRSTISVQKFLSKQNLNNQNDKDYYQKTLIIISSDRFGNGNDDLGQHLMINYVKALNEWGDDLWRLVFLSHGVKLTTEKSVLHNELKSIESSGVDILVCGASLSHLELTDKKKIGQAADTHDIIASFKVADKVINL